MTLGCGSLGGNITSDNLSPLHLINIRRVAYETGGWRPLTSPALSRAKVETINEPRIEITRQEISSVVERVLSQKNIPLPAKPSSSWVDPPRESNPSSPCPTPPPKQIPKPDVTKFVCEDDVRMAIKSNQKLYVNSKTIITPSGRDLGIEKGVLVFVD
jgi:hypothetical protein